MAGRQGAKGALTASAVQAPTTGFRTTGVRLSVSRPRVLALCRGDDPSNGRPGQAWHASWLGRDGRIEAAMKTQPIASPNSTCNARAVATGLSILALLSPLEAQSPPAPPRPPAPVAASNQATTLEGTVGQYLMNPDGTVDGLLLTNNTIVRVPPHLGPSLVESISPQDQV